jgi:hypothetical protein
MTETKHTHGPWVVIESAVIETGVMALNIVSKKDAESAYGVKNLICSVSTLDLVTEQDEANAKLVACAPDLLEACNWALQQFKRLSEEGKYPEHLLAENGGNGFMPLVTAIKKATV